MNESAAAMSANPLRVLRTVASAFFGIRRKNDSDRDLEHLNIKQIVVAAVILMALFVTVLLVIVKTVLR